MKTYRLELYEDDELEKLRAASPARIREFMQYAYGEDDARLDLDIGY